MDVTRRTFERVFREIGAHAQGDIIELENYGDMNVPPCGKVYVQVQAFVVFFAASARITSGHVFPMRYTLNVTSHCDRYLLLQLEHCVDIYLSEKNFSFLL